MKKYISINLTILCTLFVTSYSISAEEKLSSLDKLKQGNEIYMTASNNSGDISKKQRKLTANGQTPHTVVVTCSDSRVSPEHIFNAGIGELFVIRNAGNVIREIELGSIEYGAKHLQADTIIVMGHTNCGAVNATIKDNALGNIKKITDIIKKAIGFETNPKEATVTNIKHSISEIKKSDTIQQLLKEKKIQIKGALYHVNTGKVDFL